MDVLAVMGPEHVRTLKSLAQDTGGFRVTNKQAADIAAAAQAAVEMAEARAAVAELVEASAGGLNDLLAMVAAADRGEVWVTNVGTRLRLDALRAALARIGGAA